MDDSRGGVEDDRPEDLDGLKHVGAASTRRANPHEEIRSVALLFYLEASSARAILETQGNLVGSPAVGVPA